MSKLSPAPPSAAGRIKLLDAAERLFASKGYDGASLREISREAGVELGLSGYHFRNKDELFRQVFLRRAPEMAAALNTALDQALMINGPPETRIPAVLHAYVTPHLERLHGEDEGWRSYIRLASLVALFLGRPELIAPAVSIYQPVMKRFRSALGSILPEARPIDIDRRFYVFQMAILSISTDSVRSIGVAGDPLRPASSHLDVDELTETILSIYAQAFIVLRERAIKLDDAPRGFAAAS